MQSLPYLRLFKVLKQMCLIVSCNQLLLLVLLVFCLNISLDAQVQLVKDLNLNQDPLDKEYQEAVEYNGFLIFATRNELWRSGGLTSNTHLIKRFQSLRSLNVVNGQVYFAADDGNGLELWQSSGASYNTTMVKDLYAGPNGSN